MGLSRPAFRSATICLIDAKLPFSDVALPPDYALQQPHDWLQSMAAACA